MIQPVSRQRGSRSPQIFGAHARENHPDAWEVWGWLVVVALVLVGCGKPPPNADPPDAVLPPLTGIAPEACGQGFVTDGKQGCEPILPAEECPFGQMAVPGDTACDEVAPCGDGTWGDIPVETNTQFVDRAYPGNDSDGTMAKPWTTIEQGVKAAANSAIVAIAAGLYAEDVLIQGKPVRLWGRCPAMVEISGAGVQGWSIRVIEPAASDAEIHGVAVTGTTSGIRIEGATDVALENVWVHDVGLRGLEVSVSWDGPTNATVRNSLFEQNHQWGVWVNGAEATIESTVVRDTANPLGAHGGIAVLHTGSALPKGPTLTLRGCLVEQNQNGGVHIIGSDATIETTAVRSTLPNALGNFGEVSLSGITGRTPHAQT